MRVMVTGGRGYLAGHIANQLELLNAEIVIASRTPAHNVSNDGKARTIEINYLDAGKLEIQLRGVDVVIHASGLDSISCELNPQMAIEVNASYTQILIKAAINSGVKSFNYISTAHVYRSPLTGIINENSLTENTHPYASSHALADSYVAKAMEAFNFGSLSIRLANSYGLPISYSKNAMHLAVNSFCKQAVDTGEIVIKGDANSQRNFIPVQSAVAEILKLSLRDRRNLGSTIVNLGSLKSFSIGEFADIIADRMLALFDRKIIVSKKQEVPAVSPERALDYRSIFSEFTDHNHSHFLDMMLMALSDEIKSGD